MPPTHLGTLTLCIFVYNTVDTAGTVQLVDSSSGILCQYILLNCITSYGTSPFNAFTVANLILAAGLDFFLFSDQPIHRNLFVRKPLS